MTTSPKVSEPWRCANAALLLGAIEEPHEASSQLARASEVTWKWSVFSLIRVFRASLADPVRLSSTGRDVIAHLAHGLGARVVRGTAIVRDHISARLIFRSSPD